MKTRDQIRFSVVVPCFNEEDYIGEALTSLQSQDTQASYEVIVVDNNCSDRTVEIAARHGIRVVSETIPGVCAARQKGTLEARGEIIISTDADTRFAPDWLSKIDDIFKRNPALVALGGPCSYYDGPWWGRIYTHFLFGYNFLYNKLFGHPFYLTATNIAFKKRAWSGYNLFLPQAGDELDLLKQLRRVGRVDFILNNPTSTSGRRLKRGLFYNIFVSFLFYYIIGYYVNSHARRILIGQAPAFRKDQDKKLLSKLGPALIILAVAVWIPLYWHGHTVKSFLSDNVHDVTAAMTRLF